MKYPLGLTFKFWALAPQIFAIDADGKEVAYIHQKLFRLKEQVEVWNNKNRERKLFSMKADRIIDFSAKYTVTSADGQELCAAKQYGWKSIWRTRFDILEGEKVLFQLREENPWVKVMDAAMGFVPFGEIISGLVFHPSYIITRATESGENEKPVMRIHKKASLVERFFQIDKLGELSEKEETELLASSLMMVLLERRRG